MRDAPFLYAQALHAGLSERVRFFKMFFMGLFRMFFMGDVR